MTAKKGTTATDISQSGDIILNGGGYNQNSYDTFYYHDGLQQPIHFDDIVIDSSDPDQLFGNATNLAYHQLSDIRTSKY